MNKFFNIVFMFILIAFCSCAYAGSCSITASNLMFGEYGPIPIDPVNGDAKIFVSCEDNNTYTFCAYSTSTFPQTVDNGGSSLNYYLYKDNLRTAQLATGSGSHDCFPLLGGMASSTPVTASCPYYAPCQLSVYGRIPASQTMGNAGLYIGNFIADLDIATDLPLSVKAQAYVNSGCNISTDQLSFGTYDPATNNRIAQTNIHVRCTASASTRIRVGLNRGIHGPNVRNRRLKLIGGADLLNYTLYLPEQPSGICGSYSRIWRNGGGNLRRFEVTQKTGLLQSIQVCGEIPSGQTGLTAGVYQDTITATISW